MSKSLGNFFTVREVLKAYPRPGVIRMFILSSHYRSPLNYAEEQLEKAKADLTTLYTALRDVAEGREGAAGEDYRKRFQEAMDDDFNTPAALAVLFELAREVNRHKQAMDLPGATSLAATLRSLGGILGLLQEDAEAWLKGALDLGDGGLSDADIENLIRQRLMARKDKDWASSDRIRDELKALGIILEDGAGGTTWRRE